MLKKFATGFLITMLLLTWFSWKLDGLRTPQVVCVTPRLSEDGYTLPAEAVYGESNNYTVYQLEETGSYFSPLAVRRVSVSERSRDSKIVTVSGLSGADTEIVLYASRPLNGDTATVRRWENRGFTGRIEVACNNGQAALKTAFDNIGDEPFLENLSVLWEDEWLVLTGADQFTARYLQTALTESGLPAETLTIRDYAWADEILAQGKDLWRLAGAFALVWFLARCAAALFERELRRGKEALQTRFLSEYLSENSVRLLTEVLVLTVGVFVGFAVLRWLWTVQLTLPTGFLPDGSIFDTQHYRLWLADTFPVDSLSDYGRSLSEKMKQTSLFSLGESAALLLAAGFFPIKRIMKKRGSIINVVVSK